MSHCSLQCDLQSPGLDAAQAPVSRREGDPRVHTDAAEDGPAVTKQEISPFATAWVDPVSVVQREIGQSEDKHHRSSLVCGTQ